MKTTLEINGKSVEDVNKIKIEDVWELKYRKPLDNSQNIYTSGNIHDLNYYLSSDYINSTFKLVNKNTEESFFMSVYTDRFCCGLNILGNFQCSENIPQKDFNLLFKTLYEYRKGGSSRLLQCTIIDASDDIYGDYEEHEYAIYDLISNCPYFVAVNRWVNPGSNNELIMYNFKN